MRLALLHDSTDGYHASRKRRAQGFVLAVALEILIVLALLTLGVRGLDKKKPERTLTTFRFDPPPVQSMGSASPRNAARARPAEHAVAQPQLPVPLPTPLVVKPVPAPDILKLSKDEYAGMDISKLSPKGRDGAGSGTGTGKAPYGPGEGPNGQPVYPAEWYREPTRAELAGYMRKLDRSGWGMVMCRTIANYHVENCREAGESPGSGLARAMRLASWQFLVRPESVGRKLQIGSWVYIRYTFTIAKSESDDAPQPDDDSAPAG